MVFVFGAAHRHQFNFKPTFTTPSIPTFTHTKQGYDYENKENFDPVSKSFAGQNGKSKRPILVDITNTIKMTGLGPNGSQWVPERKRTKFHSGTDDLVQFSHSNVGSNVAVQRKKKLNKFR